MLSIKEDIVVVASIDFDGCLNHRQCQNHLNAEAIVSANQYFIDKLCKEVYQQQNTRGLIIMNGSSRQSYSIDYLNQVRNQTVSCFNVLMQLHKTVENKIHQAVQPAHAIWRPSLWRTEQHFNIRCRIDPYLLSDTYGYQPAGENFKQAIENNRNFAFSRFFFDETKLTILYAQTHKIASEKPNHRIIFHFYDDKIKILDTLQTVFTQYPYLLAANLILHLHYYAGGTLDSEWQCQPIQGQGLADTFYEKSIMRMVKCADYQLDDVKGLESNHDVAERLLADQGKRMLSFKKPSVINANTMIEKSALNDDLFPKLFSVAAFFSLASTNDSDDEMPYYYSLSKDN